MFFSQEKKDLCISEVRHSALYPDELEITLDYTLKDIEGCTTFILNDSHLCHVKRIKNSKVICEYPLYLVKDTNDSNCNASCQDTPGCQILQRQSQGFKQKFIRKLDTSDPFSFTPQSASFVYPSYITINLGDLNQNVTNVFLTNIQNTLEAQILKQDISSLVCIIKGGNPGNYTINIVTNSTSIISTAVFSLEIVVTSVSPSSGSIDGGVILTINGTNFSTRDEQNQVLIGNVPCTILSSSTTQLQCVTQKPDVNNQPFINQPYDVIVQYGNWSSSTQNGDGQFTFLQANNTPMIQSIASNIKGKFLQGETIIINGTNLQVNGETTVLLIGGVNTTIDSLNSTQLNFTVGFDMPNTPQNLSVHVGTQGSTGDFQVVAPSMLLSSECLDNSNYQLRSFPFSPNFIIDLTLSNYDPTYDVTIIMNNNNMDESQFAIQQDPYNKNLILLIINYVSSSFSRITSIQVGGDEILNQQILLILSPTISPYFYSTFTFNIDPNYFGIDFFLQYGVVLQNVFIRNEDCSLYYPSTLLNGAFVFPKLPNAIGLLKNSIIQGYTNYGTFTIYLNVYQQLGFLQGNSTLNIIGNPFPSNQVIPGQKFKVQFSSSFIPISDFLCVECKNAFFPIFAENDQNDDSIYEFTIPPVPLQSQFSGSLQCTLYHRSAWNSKGDSLFSKHTLFDSSFSDLQEFILTQTMIEDVNKYIITYQNSTNIIINSITPSTISYLGGDVIEFRGINFISTDVSQVQVQINGINCTVTEVTDSYIHCISGFQSAMQWIEESYVSVYVNGIKANMVAPQINMVMRQIDPLPFHGFLDFYDSGSKVYIPKYYIIIMDDVIKMNGNSVSYDRVLVDGTLVFLNSISYNITLNLLVGNGQVLIGSADYPFGQSTFKLTVNNYTDVFSVLAYSSDAFIYVNLLSSAFNGTNILNVLPNDINNANLNVGDEIFITGTTIDSVYEKVKIGSINNDTIYLTTNLTSDHIVANEILLSQDGSKINFNVSPSIFKVNMSVQVTLINTDSKSITLQNYYPQSRSFQLQGVQFQQIHLNAQRQSYNFNVTNSRLSIQDNSVGECIYLTQFLNSILIDFEQMNCYTLMNSVQNSLFISNQQKTLPINNGIKMMNNTFMRIELLLPSTSLQTVISQNIIYATDTCIRYPFTSSNQIPLIMDNNLCFSCNYALDTVYTGLIKSKKYYLIAVNILKGAIVQQNNLYCLGSYLPTTDTNNLGQAFFQSQLTNGQYNYQPVAYSSQQIIGNSQCLIINYISNVEFKNFSYQSTQNIVENVYPNESYFKLLILNNIKQDFNSTLLPNTANLIIVDNDGSFSGANTPSNLVAISSSLNESTCDNRNQYSICQNKLLHSQPIFVYCQYQTYCAFNFIRSDGNTLHSFSQSSMFDNGQIYSVNLLDGSNNSKFIQLFSMMLDYSQDQTKAIILTFPISSDYTFHQVVQISSNYIPQMYDIQNVLYYNELSSDLDPISCNHGESYRNQTNIQVCYKQIYVPVTLYVSFYPDVYPTVARVPIETRIRQFSQSQDWFESFKNLKTSSRWTILPHWVMQISQGGVYNIPSLVIQGSLEVVGSANITLNLRGIYIGAGSLTVSSSFTGKLTINLVSKNSTEIIFNNPIEGASYYEGSIVVNNNLKIQNTLNNQPSYRISKFNSQNQKEIKNQIIISDLILNSTNISKGDSIFIVSPRTGDYQLTTISDIPKQINATSVLLTLKDSLNCSFSEVLDTFTLNSNSTLSFLPYAKIFKQRIQINNFTIYSLSSTSYIPSIFLQGINFLDSKLTQQKFISSFTVQDCIFQVTKDQDYYFSNQYSDYSSSYATFSPSFLFTNNLFLKSSNPIQINVFYINKPYYIIDNLIYNIQLSNNIIVDSTNAIYSYYNIVLSNNIVIKTSGVCSSSPTCLSHNSDTFYQCQVSGVKYDSCYSISNLSVAFSGTFSQGSISQISNVILISNSIHFQAYAGGTDLFNPTIPLNKYNIQINNSTIIVDLFDTFYRCSPSSCIELITPNSYQLQVPTITIRNSQFYNIICSNAIFFKTNTPKNEIYHSSVAFQNTNCINCEIKQLSQLIQSPSSVPSSLLVQDYQSVFLGQRVNDTSSYIFTAQDTSPFIKIEHSSNILGRLFISVLSSINPNEFTLQSDTYKVQQIPSLSGTIIVFPLNNLYQLQATSYAQTAYRMSSHNLQSLEYIQLALPIGKEKGLKIRYNQQLLTPTPGLDTSNGYSIMNMVGQQQQNIQCGVNAYDPTTDSYHIILTNDPSCLIYIFEYSTIAVTIVIPTPILPPPLPSEINMCLAQRQMLYVINKISVILKIDKSRIKLRSQSNFSSCKSRRILQQDTTSSDTISFSFSIDPNDSDNQNNCTFNPNCSASDIQAQSQNIDQENLSTYKSLQTMSDKAVESGFIVNSVQPTIPILASQCLQSQYTQDSKCVSSCSSNYFAIKQQNNNFCIKCNPVCNTCTGTNPTDCSLQLNNQLLDCATGYFTFQNNSGQNYCGKCPSNCGIACNLLASPSCPDLSCKSGYVNQNGNCLLQCIPGFFNFNGSGICKPCMSGCYNQCSDGTCPCSDGYYSLVTSTSVCSPCPQLCATCSSDTVCETCLDPKYNEQTQCKTEKPVPEVKEQTSLGLILGLTFGISSGVIIVGSIISYYYKNRTKRQANYSLKSVEN